MNNINWKAGPLIISSFIFLFLSFIMNILQLVRYYSLNLMIIKFQEFQGEKHRARRRCRQSRKVELGQTWSKICYEQLERVRKCVAQSFERMENRSDRCYCTESAPFLQFSRQRNCSF